MFAIFNSYMIFNSIIANLLNILFYTYDVNSLYIFIGCYSIFLLVTSGIYWYLPNLHGYIPEEDPQENPVCPPAESVAINIEHSEANLVASLVEEDKQEKTDGVRTVAKEEDANPSLKQTVSIYAKLITNGHYASLFPYLAQSGLFQGFSQGAIYRLVVNVYANDKSVNDSFVKKMICVMLIFYSISGLMTSQISQYMKGPTKNKVMKVNSMLFAVFMVLQVFFSDLLTNFWYVVVPAVICGSIDLLFQQLIAVDLSENFPGKTEPYALFKLIQNFICAIFMIVYIYCTTYTFTVVNATLHVFLSIWFVLVFNNKSTKPN